MTDVASRERKGEAMKSVYPHHDKRAQAEQDSPALHPYAIQTENGRSYILLTGANSERARIELSEVSTLIFDHFQNPSNNITTPLYENEM